MVERWVHSLRLSLKEINMLQQFPSNQFLTDNAALNSISNRICSLDKYMHHKNWSHQFHTRLVSSIDCNYEIFFNDLTIFRCLIVRKSHFLHKHLIAIQVHFHIFFFINESNHSNISKARINAVPKAYNRMLSVRVVLFKKNQLRHFITKKIKSNSKYDIKEWRNKFNKNTYSFPV